MEKVKRYRPQLTATVDENILKVIDVLARGIGRGRLIDEAIESYLFQNPFYGKQGIIELKGGEGGYYWVTDDGFDFMPYPEYQFPNLYEAIKWLAEECPELRLKV